MRITRYLFLAATAFFLLPGCQKESPRSGGIPMQVEPTLSGDTKGSMTTADLKDFYLQVVAADPAFNYFEHASKSESGAWTTTSRMFWKDETSPVTYCAVKFGNYGFSAAEFKDGAYMELTADQSTQEGMNDADLLTMHATTSFENTNGGILPVALSHGLAKVNFTLLFGPKFYDNLYTRAVNPVKAFTVKGTNICFILNPQTGAVTVRPDTKSGILALAGAFTPGTAEDKSAKATYEAILVPQALAKGALKVTFKVGDFDYEWSNEDAITLEAGKTYDLAVSVVTAPVPEHSFVDMGNGLLWATCNVGADKPEDFGNYYAWGETTTKDTYNWSTYKWGDGSTLTKYTTSGATLERDDDAATANWGGSWRTPTHAEWTWLRTDCHWIWKTTADGYLHEGFLVEAPNGNSIFLPLSGCMSNISLSYDDVCGYYWSSTLYESIKAKGVMIAGEDYVSDDDAIRFLGYSIRPVSN